MIYSNRFPQILYHLQVIGCDGIATNTGANGGIFTLIKKNLGHSVQRVICLLHTNELPLRHLLIKLDDQTLSLNSFNGCLLYTSPSPRD